MGGNVIDKPGYRLGTDDPDPAKRLNAMLYTVGGDDFHGVLRMSVTRRMPDFGTFLHPDRAIGTELALQGPAHNAPFLYHRRQHPGQERNRVLDIPRLAVIQDPKRANRLLHPKVRLVAECRRAIHRAPLSRLQRARCYWTYLGWIATHAAPARCPARQQGTAGVALH